MDNNVIELNEKRRKLEESKKNPNLQFKSEGYIVLNLMRLAQDNNLYLMVNYDLKEGLSDKELEQIKALLTNSFSTSLDQIFNDYKNSQ